MSAVRDLAFGPLLAVARSDFYAGRYRSCIATLSCIVDSHDAARGEALVLTAFAHLRLRDPLAAIDCLTPLAIDGSAVTDTVSIEARTFLAYALSCVGDREAGNAMLPSVDSTTSSALRSDILFVAAMQRWLAGDRQSLNEILSKDECDDVVPRARRATLEAWSCYDRGDMLGFARLQDWSATSILDAREDVADIGLAAASLRGLAAVASELDPACGMFERALELYGLMPWTSELGPDRFTVQRCLAWGHALRGNFLGALSMATEAYRSAPSETWCVAALVDRAAIRRAFGEIVSSGVDLSAAIDLARSAPWSSANDEEQLALLSLAEQLAECDRAEASTTLARFSRLAGDAGVRYRQTGGAWVEALRAESFGVVQASLGRTDVAIAEISRALETWESLGFRWRAARAALRLYAIEPTSERFELAVLRSSAYPRSWLADDVADIREAKLKPPPPEPALDAVVTAPASLSAVPSAIAMPAPSGAHARTAGAEKLTPRQREVYQALCAGSNVRTIATQLSLSVNTVRVHRAAIYAMLDVSSQLELATRALGAGC